MQILDHVDAAGLNEAKQGCERNLLIARDMACIVDDDVERAIRCEFMEIIARAHVALEDAALGKHDICEAANIKAHEPRTRKILPPHLQRWDNAGPMIESML